MIDSIYRSTKPPRAPRSKFRLTVVLMMFMFLIIGIFVGSRVVTFAGRVFEGQKFSFGRFFISSDKALSGEDDGLIRVLLLGIGGEGHDGPYLTDTMILATVKLGLAGQPGEVTLFSLPRDLTVDIGHGYGYRRINSAYAYGEDGGKKQGQEYVLDAAETLLGEKIPYYAVIDFEGFKKIIDEIDGLTVTVPVTFTDANYPDEKIGYLPPLTFEAGQQTMDGTRALQYVRSRHGNNNQGSDFARSKRQQQIMAALKDQVLSLRVLSNLSLLNRVLDEVSQHFRTNLEPQQMLHLYSLTKNIPPGSILSQTLDLDSGLVCEQIGEDGAYLLIPCAGPGNYAAIHTFLQNQFIDGRLENERPMVEIQNASREGELALSVKKALDLPHLKMTTGNFTGQAAYNSSIIYDNTAGKKPATLNYLKDKLGLPTASGPFPFATASEYRPDFVIIVMPDIRNKIQ